MKTLGVQIVIGAILASGFATTTKRGGDLVTKVGATVAKQQTAMSRIQVFKTLKKDVISAEAAWKSAQIQVGKLAREIKTAKAPTKDMQKGFAAAKREAAAAKQTFTGQSQALQVLRNDMSAAGQSTRGLARQNRDLSRSYKALKRQQVQFGQLNAARDANIAKRGKLRGQLFETAAVGVVVAAPVVSAIKFESSMADVRKVINFDTPTQFKEMGNDILTMSTQMPMAASGIAEIIATAGRAGIARDELQGFASDAIKMSIAFDMSAEEAGSAMTGFRTIFKMSQKEVVGLGDAINYLDNNMDATAGQIVRISNRTGSMADLFGLTAQENAALASTFLALKTPPQVASTAMNAMMMKMQATDKRGEKFQQSLRDIGWSATDLKQAIEDDASGALVSFLEDINNSEDKIGILTDLFGLEHADEIVKLSGGLDELKRALGLVVDTTASAGAMQKEYEERAKTTANQLILLRGQFNRLAVNLGTVLLPAVNFMAKLFGGVASVLSTLTQKFPLLTTIVYGLGVGLITLRVTQLASAYAWTFMKSALISYKLSLLKFSTVLTLTNARMKMMNAIAFISAARFRVLAAGGMIKAFASSLLMMARVAIPVAVTGLRVLTVAMMTNPIGLIIGGIAIAAGLLIMNWKKVKSFFTGIWSKISGPATKAFGVLKTLFAWSPLGLLMRGIGAGAKFVGKVFTNPVAAVKSLWRGLKFIMSWSPLGLIKRGWNALPGVFKSIFGKIRDIAKLVMDAIKGFLMAPIKLVTGLWNKLKGLGRKSQQAAKQVIEPLKPALKPALKSGVAVGGAVMLAAPAGANSAHPASITPSPIQPAQVRTIRPEAIPAPATTGQVRGDIHLHLDLTVTGVIGDVRALAEQLGPELISILREAKDGDLYD